MWENYKQLKEEKAKEGCSTYPIDGIIKLQIPNLPEALLDLCLRESKFAKDEE